MNRGLYVAASGMLAEQARQDQLSNDLANAATPGYKADRTAQRAFGELLVAQRPGRPAGRHARQPAFASRSRSPNSGRPGAAADRRAARPRGRRRGLLRRADRRRACATRATAGSPPPPTARSSTSMGNAVLGPGRPARQAQGRRHRRPRRPSASSTLTDPSRPATATSPAGRRARPPARVRTGELEGSGVDAARTMVEMMASLRAFEAGQKVITTIDDTLGQAAGLGSHPLTVGVQVQLAPKPRPTDTVTTEPVLDRPAGPAHPSQDRTDARRHVHRGRRHGGPAAAARRGLERHRERRTRRATSASASRSATSSTRPSGSPRRTASPRAPAPRRPSSAAAPRRARSSAPTNPLDVALQGQGFLQMQRADGTGRLTRDGNFRFDDQGRLGNAARRPRRARRSRCPPAPTPTTSRSPRRQRHARRQGARQALARQRPLARRAAGARRQRLRRDRRERRRPRAPTAPRSSSRACSRCPTSTWATR